MGATEHRDSRSSSDMSRLYAMTQEDDDGDTWQERVHESECCGVVITRVERTKITWESRLVKKLNCLEKQFEWCKDMLEMIVNCKLPRKPYTEQINQLKQMLAADFSRRETVEQPLEMQKFKSRLKQSVVVSIDEGNSNRRSFGLQERASKIKSSIPKSKVQSLAEVSHARNKMISSHLQAIIRKSITEQMQDSISDILGEASISRSTTNELQLFMKFTVFLQEHLNDINCMLGRVQRLFIVYIQKTYRYFHKAQSQMENFVNDVNQYLLLMKEAVIDYYNLKIFRESKWHNSFLANEENILSICITILFKDNTFYSIAFGNIAEYCKEKDNRLETVLKRLNKVDPQDFEINDIFCLNARTVNHFCRPINMSSEVTEERNSNKICFLPYHDCILALKELAKTRSPINKMKTITACSEIIPQVIDRFYSENDLPREHWLLDADQMLSLFCYMIVKADIPNLHAHLFILENFSTSHQKMSVSGYYMSVLGCAVEQLMLNEESGLQCLSK